MGNIATLVVFGLRERRYALSLAVVERVIAAVEVTPLPGAPEAVLGVIDIAGTIVPVFDLRRRFGLPVRDTDPADQFIIARIASRQVALAIDRVHSVVERSEPEGLDAADLGPGVDRFRGVFRLDEDLVLIHDLERFLSVSEACALEAAVAGVERC